MKFNETKKASIKLIVALHFAKCIYLTENPTSKILSLEMINLVNIHIITINPKFWQIFVANKISGYHVQFEKAKQNSPTIILKSQFF